MFSSLLIANRGEIACRIIRTAKKMGLRTIAVYSDADAGAPHTRLADEAVHIGPSPASESYLKIDAILTACRETGAEAVHPGYGFLSENTKFAAALAEAGIVFVGPNADAIARMGDKIESKLLAEKAGVPGVPGYAGDDQADATLIRAAEKIGFPVMVKASAGGGGKGMRRVFERAALEEAIGLARAEAKSSFGDDRLLVEKLIQNPRHLEVQVAGDKHGSIIHLFERDCSVQRNNQKVLEEAPAPNLSEAVREKLFDRALKLAGAINYDSLGTVEFIMDADDDEPAFLEMNTRLQVEHPVTELVTGLDLVELQLRIAAGEPLPLSQEAVAITGHAIEARVTAERPAQDYMPDTGTIEAIHWPGGLRVDAGVEAGSEISPFYDSMIAKLIAHGETRNAACRKLAAGLAGTSIFGVETNLHFLRDCVTADAFAAGRATTKFLDETFPDGWSGQSVETADAALVAGVWQAVAEERGRGKFHGLRLLSAAGRAATSFLTVVQGQGEPQEVALRRVPQQGLGFEATCGETVERLTVTIDGDKAIIERAGRRQSLRYALVGETFYLSVGARTITATIMPAVDYAANVAAVAGGSGEVVADMPGAVVEVKVTEGAAVEAGTPLLTMESMKLLVTLEAPVAGTITAMNTAAGATVQSGEVLVIIEADTE